MQDSAASAPAADAGPGSQTGLGTEPETGLRVRCWGARGSVPTPGPHTARFGGNTSCLEVTTPNGQRLIFDAGSGIRLLGERFSQGATHAELFLSHFHWDHIQGLPFFRPLYQPGTSLRVHGPAQDGTDLESVIARQMDPIYFPVPFEKISADLQFRHFNGEPFQHAGLEVRTLRVRHPGNTHGFRVQAGRHTVAYIPDNELVGGQYELEQGAAYDALVSFLDGVDLLFHDAMFGAAEYPARTGWGHSTFEQAIRLAETAGVRRLYLFHHAPERSDAELERILAALRHDLAGRGSRLELGMATEEEVLIVGNVS